MYQQFKKHGRVSVIQSILRQHCYHAYNTGSFSGSPQLHRQERMASYQELLSHQSVA